MIAALRLDVEEVRKVLVLGALAVRSRRQRALELGDLQARPHPMPDLTGEAVEVIVEALVATIADAHSTPAPAEEAGDWSCGSCEATIELASRYGDPTGMVWPDPVRMYLADAIDEEMKRRGERPPWARKTDRMSQSR